MDRVREALEYSFETGMFVWKISPSLPVKAGDTAGYEHPNGYVMTGYRGKIYAAHRLAWFFFYGRLPKNDIDHRDGDKKNNRISNLREATEAENLWNRKLCTRNKSGVKGVHWYPPSQKWAAQIRRNGVKYFLGYFENINDAAKVVMMERARLHGEFANHGTAS